jgi:aldose sugar dehydrogenase
MLPGAHFSDPELSWKFELGPGGMGFLSGRALGPQHAGDLFMGGSRDFLEGGHLFRIQLTGNRRKVAGRNFGLLTDVLTGPDGQLYVVSNTRGTVYEIFRP